jgi:large subunit ribosomal protein L30
MAMKSKLRVTQIKSTIGQKHGARATVHGLGLRGLGTTVVVSNTPSFRGAVKKVIHLLRVEEIDNG